jgi:DNA-binding PadR family transcriptional regulator
MAPQRADLLQGTLDMLVMRAVSDEPLHGYALVNRLRLVSGDRLRTRRLPLPPRDGRKWDS